MARVLIVETKPSSNQFKEFEFKFDKVSLTEDATLKKVLKKDVSLDINIVKDYDWVILVGSEPFKMFTKKTSVMDYCGKVVDEKFIPVFNPAMLSFKPEVKSTWETAVKSINGYVSGKKKASKYSKENFKGIETSEEAEEYLQWCLDQPGDYVAMDSETTGFYPRKAEVLGISICAAPDTGAYISADSFSEKADSLVRKIINLVYYRNVLKNDHPQRPN
jgi:hypothetical protein